METDRRLPRMDCEVPTCRPGSNAAKLEQPEIIDLIDGLGAEIDRLSSQLELLESRLRPVMAPPPPYPGNPDRQTYSPVGATLAAYRSRVAGLADCCGAIRGALQI